MAKTKQLKYKNSAGTEQVIDLAVDAQNIESNTFSQAGSRSNLVSGDSIPTVMGKLAKWFADIKSIAWTGKWADLSEKPGLGDLSGTLSINKGGTGATSASAARTNLGVGAAGTQGIANNCTTTAAGYALDARQGKTLMDKANQISSDLGNTNTLLAPGISNLAGLLQYWIDSGYLNDPNLRMLVPYLTGNDSRIIHNSSNGNYPFWQVYDNNMTTAGIGATYIGYDFGTAVCVRRIEWQGFNANYTGFGKNSHVQASADGANWINVHEFDGGNSYNARVVNAFANSQSYRFWRVQNGTGVVVGLAFLQFYGK